MGRLFGTDGVRGKAGQYPLDIPTIRRLGAALARALGHGSPGVRFLAGRDTRESGEWIERELAAGIASEGGTLASAGVIPTPAIAYLTPRMGYTAGAVISASHNPFGDNGIKVFSGTGEKFTERLEDQVESIMAGLPEDVAGSGVSRPVEQIDYRSDYISHLLEILPPTERHRSLRIVVDCANGATTTVAPRPLQAAWLRREMHRLCSGRAQHQPGLRIDGARAACADGRRGRVRHGHRLRRRRRPRDLRRCRRPRRRRRRRDADVREADEGGRPAERQRPGGHGDEQHRSRNRAARCRDRAAALRRGRQVRDGGDAEARPVAWRRAVGPCHLLGAPVHRRRPGDVAATYSAPWPRPGATLPIWPRI